MCGPPEAASLLLEMRQESHALDVKAGNLTGAPQSTEGLVEKWVHIRGTFVATIEIEGTMDGTNWITFATETTAALVEVLPSFKAIRIKTSGFSSGAPLATLGGRNSFAD